MRRALVLALLALSFSASREAQAQRFGPALTRVAPRPPSQFSSDLALIPARQPMANPSPWPVNSVNTILGPNLFSGYYWLPGGQVAIPSDAPPGRYRLWTIETPSAGPRTILYDSYSGTTLGFDLATSVGREYRSRLFGDQPTYVGATNQPGSGTFSGSMLNPSVGRPLSATAAGTFSGSMPMINALTPSYNYQLNAPPTTASPLGVGIPPSP